MNNLPKQMTGIKITEAGEPAVLCAETYDLPLCDDFEVLIKVHAAGVNRPDCLQRAGLYAPPEGANELPGLEVAGEVVALGKKVEKWLVGNKVVALTHGGGYAEYCVANEGHCLPWPDTLGAEEAATLPETTFTVYHNLIDRGELKNKETVLIHGGSSGIGSTAIQLAKSANAKVIVTAGTDEKCAYCLNLGADFAINYKKCDFEVEIRSIQNGLGIDVVLDMVAGSYVKKNLKLLSTGGRYIMIAFLGGARAEVNFGYVLSKRLALKGSTLRPQSTIEKSAIAEAVLKHVWPLVAAGKITSNIYATFPLRDARKAHELMESNEHVGKIVLKVI